MLTPNEIDVKITGHDDHLAHGDEAPCIHVRKYVSGCAPAKRDRRTFVMLHQLVLDESGYGQTDSKQCFTFAGFLGNVRKWENLADEWDALLKEPPTLSAKGFKNLLRRKRDSARICRFVEVLERCNLWRISVIIPRIEYEKAVLAEIPRFKKLGLGEDVIWLLRNEYYFAFFTILDAALIPMVEQPLPEADKLQVVYDENLQEREKLKSGYKEFLVSLPKDASRLSKEPTPDTDEDFLGIQAADLYAWHLHRDYVDRQDGSQHKDRAWSALQKIREYPGSMILNEGDLRQMARWEYLEKRLRECES